MGELAPIDRVLLQSISLVPVTLILLIAVTAVLVPSVAAIVESSSHVAVAAQLRAGSDSHRLLIFSSLRGSVAFYDPRCSDCMTLLQSQVADE